MDSKLRIISSARPFALNLCVTCVCEGAMGSASLDRVRNANHMGAKSSSLCYPARMGRESVPQRRMFSAAESPFSVADFLPSNQVWLFQIGERVAEALQAYGNADAGLRRVEGDEHGGAAGLHLVDDLVLQHHLRHAAALAAFEEGRIADVLAVDLESEPGGQQHAERNHYAKQLLVLADRLIEHDRETDIRPVLGGDALHQRAFLFLGPRRGAAGDLPGAVGL